MNVNLGIASFVALVVISLAVRNVVAQAPIPDRPPGFIYKPAPDALVVLEAFVDLICPDSKAAWLTYQEVADHYGPEKVRFSALVFPLPYHRAAMMAAQSAFVANDLDPELTYDWFNKVFEEQAALYDDAIFYETEWFIWETLAAWAGEIGYNETEFAYHLSQSDKAFWAALIQFKYGGTRGVFGTPQTYVNGALINSEPSWTLEDWKKIIDPLISGYYTLDYPQLPKDRGNSHDINRTVFS